MPGQAKCEGRLNNSQRFPQARRQLIRLPHAGPQQIAVMRSKPTLGRYGKDAHQECEYVNHVVDHVIVRPGYSQHCEVPYLRSGVTH
jgi:hypothetical protein